MIEAILALCMSVTAAEGMDTPPVINFDGSIARGTADYVIIEVKDDHGSVIWTTGQVQQGTTYDIPNDFVYISTMNGYEPFTVVCTYYDDNITTSSVTGIYFPEDFTLNIIGSTYHFHCTNNF